MAAACGFSQVFMVLVLMPYKAANSEMEYAFTIEEVSGIAICFVVDRYKYRENMIGRKNFFKVEGVRYRVEGAATGYSFKFSIINIQCAMFKEAFHLKIEHCFAEY